MIVDEPRTPRAERFGAIVDAALTAWAARWPLYLLIAGTSICLELIAGIVTRYDTLTIGVVMYVIDAFIMAFVSIDVAARFRQEQRTVGEIARHALRRWPAVAIVQILILFIGQVLFTWLFGTPDQTLYGTLILPALAVFGALGVTTVIASIDTSLPYFALPGYAFLRSMMYVTTWPNLGRLTLGGAILAVQMMLEQLLEQWLHSTNLAAPPAFFWANVPVDALFIAPLQAFFTYLYLDFVVREQEAQGPRTL